MNYKTAKEAALYIYDTLKKTDPEGEILEPEKIEELIKDDILDKLEIEIKELEEKVNGFLKKELKKFHKFCEK